ncbi:gamma-aminobutyric acid receptor subunit beta-like [Ruditapes philippinarum]|uniref:gamma-aminobutyric acid receptor subunit beta-like n=1 Tax=Ruditapes philippinarum TaxID=129788 RepID=UPI00295A6FFE|nr:gamma-aminobutyric acid receptor subunit beta-like [Ruditapes philippinarum]
MGLKKVNAVILAVFLMSLQTDVYSEEQMSRQTLIEDLLNPSHYDSSVPPGKPTNVKIQLIINDTIMENEHASEISGLTTVIMHWIDSRLDYSAKASYPSLIIRGSAKLKPWVPDIFILENREPYITGFGSTNELIVFNSSGNVVFNHRFTTRMLFGCI